MSPYTNTNQLNLGSGNGNGDESLPENSILESNQIHPDHHDSGNPTNYYSGAIKIPPDMLSSSSFWSYFKNSDVMLTLLNPDDGSSNVPNTSNCVHQPLESSGEKIPILRLFKCRSCGKYFKQKVKLAQHERIHIGPKSFMCIYCGRNFRLQTRLNTHLRIHTEEKPYKCLQCGKNFKKKDYLDRHTKIHQG